MKTLRGWQVFSLIMEMFDDLAIFEQLSTRAIKLGTCTFCRKNCRRKSGFGEDFYAADFFMVHQI